MRRSVILSILFHALLFGILLMHFARFTQQPLVQPDTTIIKAVAVNPNHVQSQIDRIKMEQQRQQQLAQQREQQKQEQLQQQQKELQRTEQKALQAKRQESKLEAQKAEQEKLLQQQIQEEKMQQEVQKEKEKQDKVKEEKRKQQKQLAQKLKMQQQEELQKQIEQEQRQLADASAKQNQSEIDKYRALIVQAIQQNWIVPAGVDKDLSCELSIQVGPGGSVINVQITHSSGNAGLDNSARTAVLRASPLPVPQNAALFDQFRQLRLTVKPENMISG